MNKSTQPIIIKKVKKAAHGHHGGAWKIAYADFVTAMMAFFLLMWLLAMTTPQQKKGLSEYFSPTARNTNTRGGAGILAGATQDKLVDKSQSAQPELGRRAPSASPDAAMGTTGQDEAARGTISDRASVQAQHSAMASLRQALQNMPEIAELSRNIVIEQTKEGVNVSLVDQDGRSMFPEGSVQPYEHTRLVLNALAPTMRRLPNRLSVIGHTAAARAGSSPVRGVDSWSLTAGRALAVRAILSGAGLPHDRFSSVAGRADTEPFFPDNPYIPANRRVTITLLNEAPPAPRGGLR